MFTLVILYTLYTPIYLVYPCLPLSYCIPCIPLYILCTDVCPSNTVYLVYPYISFTLVILYTLYTPIYIYPGNPCLPWSYCIPCIPLCILSTHVYLSNTVYPVYPYVSGVPMRTLLILYTLYTPIHLVYPCLPL